MEIELADVIFDYLITDTMDNLLQISNDRKN